MPRRARKAPVPGELGPGRLEAYLFYWIGQVDNLYKRRIAGALRPMRMTIAWWRALAVLTERNGATIGELAEITVFERTALTRVIDHMVRRGLVRRKIRAGDRRVVEIYITAAGRALFRRVLPTTQSVYRRATAGIDPAAIAALIAELKRMRARLAGSGTAGEA